MVNLTVNRYCFDEQRFSRRADGSCSSASLTCGATPLSKIGL